jgi:transcriptional regulator with XRE-family HTH domain
MSITRGKVALETARRMRRLGLQIGEDIHRLRSDTGVSISQLAAAADMHRSHLARIEANQVQPSLTVLAAIGVALGADLSLRYFPGSGPRLHDRFQAAMIEAVLRSLDRRWVAELEVPVTQPARGVIDLVLTDRSSPTVVASEAQSELRRLEQQIRWGTEKAHGLAQRLAHDRPTGVGYNVSRLLILRSTMTTRELARRYEATLAVAYPARTADVVGALTTSSAPWPGAGIAWIRIDGANVTLLRHPPRGVDLGR